MVPENVFYGEDDFQVANIRISGEDSVEERLDRFDRCDSDGQHDAPVNDVPMPVHDYSQDLPLFTSFALSSISNHNSSLNAGNDEKKKERKTSRTHTCRACGGEFDRVTFEVHICSTKEQLAGSLAMPPRKPLPAKVETIKLEDSIKVDSTEAAENWGDEEDWPRQMRPPEVKADETE